MACKLLGFLLLYVHPHCAHAADDGPLMRRPKREKPPAGGTVMTEVEVDSHGEERLMSRHTRKKPAAGGTVMTEVEVDSHGARPNGQERLMSRHKRKKPAAGGTIMTEVEVDSHGARPKGEEHLMSRHKRKKPAAGGTVMIDVEVDSHGDAPTVEKNMAMEMQGEAQDVAEVDSSGFIRTVAMQRKEGPDLTSEDGDPKGSNVEDQKSVLEEDGPKGEGEEVETGDDGKEADPDDDGTAFEAKMKGQVSVPRSDISRFFDNLDADKDGTLDIEEGKNILTFFPDRSDFNWHDYTDVDDGHISKAKFKQAASARLSLGPPRLCDAKIVAALCAKLNGDTSEYYDTAADANVSVVHAKEIAETLSTSVKNILAFLQEIGATNVETDADAKSSGAFGVTCEDLCQKTVESLPYNRRPPASEVACYLDVVGEVRCDVDVSRGTAWVRARQQPVIIEKTLISGTPAIIEELQRSGGWSYLNESTFEGYTVEELKTSVANLFSIYPPTASATNPANFLETVTNHSEAELRAEMRQKVAASQAWIAQTITALAGGSLGCHLKKWFRSDSASTRKSVIKMFNSLDRSTMNIDIRIRPSRCKPNVVAYVRPGSKGKNRGYIVNFCDGFFRSKYPYQLAVIIHEVTHHFGTRDHNYGWGTNQKLSRGTALNNADTYECFSEDANSGDRYTGRPGACSVISPRRRGTAPRRRTAHEHRRKAPPMPQACFPGDASVWVKNAGPRKLEGLRNGELIAVADPQLRQVRYEAVLGDFHSERAHKQTSKFSMITHEYGTLNASSTHYIATVGHGFLPVRHVKVGDHLLVRLGDETGVKPSKILNIRNVTKLGIYAPFTFGGSLLVDGVLSSAYTDLTWAFLSPQSQERVVAGLGGHNSLNTLMHLLALPLRTAYVLRIPDLTAWIPFMRGFLKPDPENVGVATNSDMPKYVDWLGRLAGACLESIY